MVNIRAGGLVVRPCQSTLKYSNYKKDANAYAHVKVFQTIVRANGKTFEEYIINTFS
jgi:hypothetical protein